ADPGAATVTVTCTYSWGQCPFDQVPIPAGATPNAGSDGVLVVLHGDLAYELWQAKSDNSSWTASWGAVNNISSVDGWGWGGSATGSGASRAAGVVRVAEIEAGVIDHALVVQTDTVCADVVRTPAIKTDGDSQRSDCIPEGARIQLDPSIDLDTIAGLTRGERAVAEALQVYGAYVIDRGGSPMSISFERAADASGSYPGEVYSDAGFRWDYDGMPDIPWSKMRVLANWDS
ncbi:MAG: hypothetical protein QM650_12830, partial [Microlunatus sp.]